MQERYKTQKGWFSFAILKTFIELSRLLPRRWIFAICGALANAFFRFHRRRREITIRNIRSAFPEKNDAQAVEAAQAAYREASKTVAEIILVLTHRLPVSQTVINSDEVLDRLARLRRTHPGGWVWLTAHYGNWEVLALFLSYYGYTMLVVGREGDNRLIEERLTQPFRRRYGNDTVFKKHAAVKVMKRLKRGGSVGILMDQKVHRSQGVKVRFFGRETYASSLVATLQEKLDIAVIPIFAVRVAPGRFRIRLGEPIPRTQSVTSNTQAYYDAMESVIRREPSQWLWMHDRWRPV